MCIVQGLGHDLFKAKIKYSRHLVMEWDFDQVLKVNDNLCIPDFENILLLHSGLGISTMSFYQ